MIVPSGFHANEGATGLRRLYLEEIRLINCFSFENRKKYFEIDSRFKFDLIVSANGQPAPTFLSAFYLQDDEWLFGDWNDGRLLQYDNAFVHRTGGDYLTLLELRSQQDLDVSIQCFSNSTDFRTMCEHFKIKFSQELNMTYDSNRFMPTNDLCTLPVHSE